MKAFYTDHFLLPLPDGHRFPIDKYRRLRERVARLEDVELREPAAATDEELVLAHARAYVTAVATGALTPAEQRRIGFPWSPGLVERSRRSVGGTLAAARTALREGVAVNLAGGTHHAFAAHGEGFCVFNDVAVAARVLQRAGVVERVAVLDTDVHQGNGTAAIFADDDSVFTCSLHGADNYPFHKQRSDLDLELPDGAGDEAYLEGCARALAATMERTADVLFFVSGADPFAGDRLGRLRVSAPALAERDRRVFAAVAERRQPVVVTMAGGYGHRIDETVDIHFATVAAAARSWSGRRQ